MKPSRIQALALCVTTLLFPARLAHGGAVVWTNTAGGKWSVAANWSPSRMPGSTDDVLITNAGSYTVTLDTSPTVNSLTLGGGSGQQTLAAGGYSLTLGSNSEVNANGILSLNGGWLSDNGGLNVNGQIAWSGGGLGTANVALNIGTNGSLVMSGGSGATYNLGQPLANAGTVQLVSGNLLIYDAGYYGSLTNLPGGVVELTADNTSIIPYGTGSGFNNEGILVKSGGTGTSTISVSPFYNSGPVEANTGTISINAYSTMLSTGSQFIGAGQTKLSAGTVTMNGSLISSNLVLAGAIFNDNGVLNGVLTWTSGTLGTVTNAMTIASNSVLVLAGATNNDYNLGQPVNNAGTIYLQSGNLQIYASGYYGSLTNLPGAVVDLAADVSIVPYGTGPGFINEGTVVKSGGTGTSAISVSPFYNSGSVEANTGTISINAYTTTLSMGSQFIGAGQTVLSGGYDTMNGSLISSNLVLAGATFNGNGVLNGVLTWTSGILGTATNTLTIATNSVLVLAGANGNTYSLGQPLNNAGTFYLQSGNLQIYASGYYGSLTNLPGAVVDLMADVSIVPYGTGPGFINEGTVVKSGGTGTSTISVSPFYDSGMVAANTGTISLNAYTTTLSTGSQFIGAGQTVLSGGYVTLNGSIICSNVVLAGATFEGNGVLNGLLTWTSGTLGTVNTTLTIATNAVLVLAGVNGSTYYLAQPLNNEGTFNLQSGNLQIYSAGYYGFLTNSPGGVVDLAGNVSISEYGGGLAFINEGTILECGGTNTNTISSVFSNNGGSVSLASGTLSLSGNNLAQGGGTLAFNLGGTNAGQSGVLTGVGSATLGGLLTVTLANGFVPVVGSTFHILSSSSRSGTLAPLNIPAGMSVSYSNNGVYLTVTTNVTLTPAITTVQPTNQTVPYAGSAAFTVAATGMAPLSYRWYQSSGPLSDGGVVAGSATAALELNGVTDNDAGNYWVVVTNQYGSATSSVVTLAVLNCTAPPAGLVSWWPGNGNALDIISGNNGVATNGVTYAPAEVGEGFDFTTNHAGVVIGNPTNLQLQSFSLEGWIERASSSVATTDPTDGNGSGLFFGYGYGGYCFGLFSNGTLFLSQTGVSYVSSAAAVTDTNFHHVAVTAAANGAVYFYLDGVAYSASGSYSPRYTFTTPAAIGARGDNVNTNVNASFYGIINQLSVYNTVLSSNQIAAIYGAGAAGKCLSDAPAITGQPQGQTAVLGGTAIFSVEATGLLPMTNQWQLGNSNLTDNGRIFGSQSNVLVISNVQFSDAGLYTVSLSNIVGHTVSQPVALTVLRKTPVVTWSNAVSITYGATLTASQLDATSSVPGTFAYNPPAGTILDAGSYLLSVVFTPTDTVDYNNVTQTVSLTVQPAPLGVTANNASRSYGQANPAFTGAMVGLQGLDRITVTYASPAVPASPPGGYPIVPTLVDPFARLANYAVSITNGTLTINAAAPPVLSAISRATGSIYGGQTLTLTGTNFEVGAAVAFGSALASNVTVTARRRLPSRHPRRHLAP